MSTVKQIRAFVAVASTQSFAEACGIVNLSQPALSIAIKNLEHDLGGPLLVRSTRTLSLTPEGEAFLPVARRLLQDWDASMEDVKKLYSLKRGQIAIAAMPSFASNLLPDVLVRFRKQHPQIHIRVQDVIAEQVVEMVRAGRVELGISFDPGDSEDLHFHPLFEDRFVAILPPSEHQVTSMTWATLLTHPFIALQRPASLRLLQESSLAQHSLVLDPAFEAHQLATIGRMVAKGLGVSAVPALCQHQMQEMGAHICTLSAPLIQRQVGLLTRRRYPLSVAAQALHQALLS